MFPGDSQPRNVRDLGGSGLGGIICPGEEDILGVVGCPGVSQGWGRTFWNQIRSQRHDNLLPHPQGPSFLIGKIRSQTFWKKDMKGSDILGIPHWWGGSQVLGSCVLGTET